MKKRILFISGLSGAGKSSVSNILEDLGYLCIDQFPSALINSLLDLVQNDASGAYQNIAITLSIMDLEYFFDYFNNTEVEASLILLDCDYDILLNRYRLTRRIHPLLISNKADTLEEAIQIEKEILAKFSDKFDVIDTTSLDNSKLRITIDTILKVDTRHKFTISFVSFGFKNGVPQDADLVFDVRFLDNPFYIDSLKNLTGNDSQVFDYVMTKSTTKEYLIHLHYYLDYSFRQYIKEGKRHLTVAIGCTGGQHRSASLVNYLFTYYKKIYNCYKMHRDIHD